LWRGDEKLPDVLTHLLFGISIALIIRRDDSRPEQMLIVLGALLIDIERPITWILGVTDYYWVGLTSGFHSILGAIVLSYVAAVCFYLEETPILDRLRLVLIGCTSHLLLDMTMNPWPERGLYLFYPLRIPIDFGIFWPDFWGYPLFGMAMLTATVLLRYGLTQKAKNRRVYLNSNPSS
jgi:membrane-bound metal-dependent hydrolase YbcI (DUF457 family)